MDSFVRDSVLAHLLHLLNAPGGRGVLVLGAPGAGKTVLLQQLEAELRRQGRAVFAVDLRSMSDEDLTASILNEIPPLMIDVSNRTIRSSGGKWWQDSAVRNRTAEGLRAPVLLLDGLDEARHSLRTTAIVEKLSRALDGWRLVVASRPAAGGELRRFAPFDVVHLELLTKAEMTTMVRRSRPDLSEDAVNALMRQAGGNPLALHLLTRLTAQDSAVPVHTVSLTNLTDYLHEHVDHVLKTSQDPATLGALVDELAIAGGRDRISALSGKLRIPEEKTRELLSYLQVFGLLEIDQQAGTTAYIHVAIQEFVLSRRVFTRPFRLAELRFGTEEAEQDDLLDASFVGGHNRDKILVQRRSIVIGDRGAGKSAIFRKLAEEQSVTTLPVTNSGDLLCRIGDKDAWLDTAALRAAWLVIIGAVIASTIPLDAPKELRRSANDLRAVLGLCTEPLGWFTRLTRTVGRLLGGTTLKFGVGPVNFEAELPTGTRPGGSFLDAAALLRETDQLFERLDQRVVILLDRIDETFKYDRNRQEAVIQALLQAESLVTQLVRIELVVFLRTDLFELYDIQEKNKLVSRSITLEWSEEDWLRVLIRRVFANEPFARLARRLRVDDEDIEIQAALEVLFPAEIEKQPVDRWLVDSLRNGNGDISPRLAVLLLHLTRERSTQLDSLVSAVPVFSADALQRAMTKLSDLSFSELVNDFKVASTFVLNCRAGKIAIFTLSYL